MDHIQQTVVASGEGRVANEAMPSLMAGLTRAMHETAARERARMTGVVADDARKHVELAHSRAAIEAAELRRSADDDIELIETWSADEIARIREETQRRKAERRADLETYLEQHATIIDAEVAGVDFAVAEYQATLDAFIDGLLTSNDAADIARRAGAMPTAPDLDRARATARAEAVARFVDDSPGVGVMDPSVASRPDGLAMAVDPLQAPDEELVVVAAAVPVPDDGASAPSRLIRVLNQWIAAPDPKRQDAAPKG
jgi:hypothetical protein